MCAATAYYVEKLTRKQWRAIVAHCAAAGSAGGRPTVWYFDADHDGLSAAGDAASRLEFRLVDVRDEDGNLLRMRIAFGDFFAIQDDIVTTPEFQAVLADPRCTDRMPPYLAKQTAALDSFTDFAVWRAMLLVQIAAWHARREGAEPVLFMARKVWQESIIRYGRSAGVEVVPVGTIRPGWKSVALAAAGPLSASMKSLALRARYSGRLKAPSATGAASALAITPKPGGSAMVAFEHNGHLNLDQPELHSDAFFQQCSDLPAARVIGLFGHPADPLDAEKAVELASHGMLGAATDPRALALRGAPLFDRVGMSRIVVPRVSGGGAERRWLRQQVAHYATDRTFWHDLFSRYGIRAFVTWYKYSSKQAAIADAARDAGGIVALYQRGFEEISSPEAAVNVDVCFGFGPEQAKIELGSGSNIAHHVSTGYLGDHRFALLRPAARELRERLRAAGAEHVVAFFDEGSAADERWHTGHAFMRVNYRFLLERVLSHPDFGVVFKPKTPATLRARLGEVADLLARAEATGRCYVCEGGTLVGSYPPAFAALASDIAIHGHLVAATAGVEAALTGTPTLLMDREGWPISRFYDLGLGRVVFNDWDTLWSALSEHWHGSGVPGLGQWGEELDRIDPFRDGRAAERMGTFLNDYLRALDSGADRDAALANAAERYTAIWGDWTIEPVRSDYPRTPSARTGGVRP